jgi:hypothetical protein
MGVTVKLQLTLFTCGGCDKPRGLHHLCRGTRKGRDKPRLTVRYECKKCGRSVRNPFRHTCSIRTDWARRRKAAARRAKAAARRELRKKRAREAAARRKAVAAERRAKARDAKRTRPRAERHNPRNCRDPECTRYPCHLYDDGFTDGLTAAAQGRETR